MFALWVAAGGLLLAAPGVPPVNRAAEARVLETAREMLDAGGAQWLVPHANGRPRMRKPPLAYWLTAGAFRAFGVGEGAGRVPAVIAAWLTLGLAGHMGCRLFGRRAGFFAAAALCGSALFFRHARLAETDVLAMLFATAATYAVWRGCDEWPPIDDASAGSPASPNRQTNGPRIASDVGWFHLAAVAMALAALAKGPPAAFALVFLAGWCAVERDARPLWRFLVSGAPVTFLVIALPWFAYTAPDPAAGQLLDDLKNSAAGGAGTWDSPHVYVHQLAVAAAPWTGLLVVAVVAAVQRVRTDWRLRGLVLWTAAVLLPLCLWGNKQRHYLLTVMPPLTLLVGWLIDASLRAVTERSFASAARAARVAAVWTLVACALAVPAIPVAGALMRGRVSGDDWRLAGLLAVGIAAVLRVRNRRGIAAAATAFAVANLAVSYAAIVLWAPTLQPVTSRVVADQIVSRYGPDVPLVFVRREDLSLVFHLRRIIPVAWTDAELVALAEREPRLVGIEVLNNGRPPRTAMIAPELRLNNGDDTEYLVGPIVPDARQHYASRDEAMP